MAVGDRAEAIPMLLSGEVRVYIIGESGRGITLYRFSRGECCVLTADALIGRRVFPANAQVEADAEMVLIPAAVFDDSIARHGSWREFVFEAMARRMTSLMTTLEDVAFRRMDLRVATLLISRSTESASRVEVTHRGIADELGSSREVISRILEDLKGRGLVELSAEPLLIADAPDLVAATVTSSRRPSCELGNQEARQKYDRTIYSHAVGRGGRIVLGVALIVMGLGSVGGPMGVAMAVTGLLPLTLGIINGCILAPFLRVPFRGSALPERKMHACSLRIGCNFKRLQVQAW